MELLSLDVEGHERQVLDTINWDRWVIDVILLEVPPVKKDVDNQILDEFKTYLSARGYRYIGRIWDDAVFKKVLLTPCPLVSEHPNMGFRFHLANQYAIMDYACPTEVLFLRIQLPLETYAAMLGTKNELKWLSIGTHNSLFHAVRFVTEQTEAMNTVGLHSFGGSHDYVDIFGGDQLSMPNKRTFPTSTFWLYHINFVDIAQSVWAIFDGLEQLGRRMHDMVARWNIERFLPACEQRGIWEMDVDHPDVELLAWTWCFGSCIETRQMGFAGSFFETFAVV